MKSIELTIKATYLSEWGIYEGLRELIQNAKDGDTEGFTMNITYCDNMLRIENKGTSLPHQALLFGHTTKINKNNQIGQFGEGMKIGCMALVRSGRKVKIQSGPEIWTPAIRMSDSFGEKVLVFDISSAPDCGSIIIDVEISNEEWLEYKKNFLFLNDYISLNDDDGSILVSPEYFGKLYVKGIFVQNAEEFKYGYNFCRARVDRDRKMVASYELENNLKSLWENILYTDIGYNEFVEIVENDSFKDSDFLNNKHGYYLPLKFCEFVAGRFFEKYGQGTIPVSSEAEALELSHLGATCIVINNKKLINVVQTITGDKAEVKRKLSNSITKEYKFNELNPDEKKNFVQACLLVQKAMNTYDLDLRKDVKIVKFGGSSLYGQWSYDGVKLSRTILHSFYLTLSTLIHEVAHFRGNDGFKAHIQAIEEGWQNVFSLIREKGK